MTNGKLLRQLIKFGTEGDVEAFRNISEQIISEEREKQHHVLADDLEKVLHGRAARSFQSQNNTVQGKVPVDRERGLPLIDLKVPVKDFDDLILSSNNAEVIHYILLQHHKADLIRSYGLSPANKILFFGPPGCGKTLAAEVIANDLQYYFGIVRIDSLVSSYLGETATNLKSIFDFINVHPMVLLFDEFDSIARDRENANEHGELKRVVNAVLQMMDSYTGAGLLIAATNHEHVLDSAIWRRFEETVIFNLPSREEIDIMLGIRLSNIKNNIYIKEISEKFIGKSFSDVERVVTRAIKHMILNKDGILNDHHILNALASERYRP